MELMSTFGWTFTKLSLLKREIDRVVLEELLVKSTQYWTKRQLSPSTFNSIMPPTLVNAPLDIHTPHSHASRLI